jgi:hypothetical protein
MDYHPDLKFTSLYCFFASNCHLNQSPTCPDSVDTKAREKLAESALFCPLPSRLDSGRLVGGSLVTSRPSTRARQSRFDLDRSSNIMWIDGSSSE